MTISFNPLGLLLALLVALSGPVFCQELGVPQNFKVEMTRESASGRWDAVSGASYYEVWTEAFGRWRFDEKNLDSSPLTSSFQLPTSDRSMKFKVRAVGPNGEKGEFSAEVVAEQADSKTTASKKYASGQNKVSFDLDAPAPKTPTSLFAVWNKARVIRLVWKGDPKAARYSVEEQRDGKWISVSRIKFPKKNTALIEGHPMPGPYKFRVRAVGKNGKASKPSRSTTAKR